MKSIILKIASFFTSWETVQKALDWFLALTIVHYFKLLLLLILMYLGFNYVSHEKERHASTQKQITMLEDKVIECNRVLQENTELREELTELKVNNIMLKASSDYLPFPFWIKDRSGVMIYLNSAYEQTYLRPRNLSALDYVGKRDEDVWGKEIGDKFRQHDSLVLAKDRPITFIELDGQKFTKFTIRLGDYIIGVAGVEYIDYKD
jgi:hypothetical protein